MRCRDAALGLVLVLAISTVAVGAVDRRAETLANGESILAGVELTGSTPIADLNADPEAFEGEIVQVEGVIVALCQNMGCWASIDDGQGNQINVKVEDGVIDWREITATEHYIVAEGVFQTVGEHGAQVFIMEHGAVVSSD